MSCSNEPDTKAQVAHVCEDDCPICDWDYGGDVQYYSDSNFSWCCPNCGDGEIWGEDPREKLPFKEDDEEEMLDERDECDETSEKHPDAWRRLLEERGSSSRARALLERRLVPEFLECLFDVHQHLALGILESLDVGHVCAKENDLELLEIDGLNSSGHRMLAILRGGRRGFSIEPTATEGNYLVFAYF